MKIQPPTAMTQEPTGAGGIVGGQSSLAVCTRFVVSSNLHGPAELVQNFVHLFSPSGRR